MNLERLPPLDVPSEVPGIYVTLLKTGEVKIGSAADIRERHKSEGFEDARVLAVMPGWRGVEADLHARFRKHRSRAEGAPMFREAYHAVPPICAFVREARSHGFTMADLQAGIWKGARHHLPFDNGERLVLEITYLPFIKTGDFFPRYILERRCRKCGESRNSLQFLNDFSIDQLGVRPRSYLVLNSTDTCADCKPKTFPAKRAFPDGQTSLRIGKLRARSGEWVRAYDRDWKEWAPLVEFGIRRMAKHKRVGHKNDLSTLRLQPSRSRHGRAQGHPEFECRS
jgi:hypothetical protein